MTRVKFMVATTYGLRCQNGAMSVTLLPIGKPRAVDNIPANICWS